MQLYLMRYNNTVFDTNNYLAFSKIPDTGSVCGTKYRFAHALFGVTINFIPDKEPKYQTVQLNTGLLATLNTIVIGTCNAFVVFQYNIMQLV